MQTNQGATIVEIQTYFIKNYVGPNLEGAVSKSYEILGGVPLKSEAATGTSLVNSSPSTPAGSGPEDLDNIFTSKYPASLSTNDAVYIHFNTLETGNYASSSYSPNMPENQRCVESSLFARIPIDHNAYHEQNERIERG